MLNRPSDITLTAFFKLFAENVFIKFETRKFQVFMFGINLPKNTNEEHKKPPLKVIPE